MLTLSASQWSVQRPSRLSTALTPPRLLTLYWTSSPSSSPVRHFKSKPYCDFHSPPAIGSGHCGLRDVIGAIASPSSLFAAGGWPGTITAQHTQPWPIECGLIAQSDPSCTGSEETPNTSWPLRDRRRNGLPPATGVTARDSR